MFLGVVVRLESVCSGGEIKESEREKKRGRGEKGLYIDEIYAQLRASAVVR